MRICVCDMYIVHTTCVFVCCILVVIRSPGETSFAVRNKPEVPHDLTRAQIGVASAGSSLGYGVNLCLGLWTSLQILKI
jgi:hypothetical protein